MVESKQNDSTSLESPLDQMLRRLPDLLRRLESVLYITAPSMEEYLDKSTLKNRLKSILLLQSPQPSRKRVSTE